MLTQEELKERLSYDADTGLFTWNYSMANGKVRYKSIAGRIGNRGYIQISVNKSLYLAHRLVWLYIHGEFPAVFIDHIDGNPSNNRISNLRPATRVENQRNRKIQSTNTSGVKGVSWNTAKSKWVATIAVCGKRIYLGAFDTVAEATEVYRSKAIIEFEEFYREA